MPPDRKRAYVTLGAVLLAGGCSADTSTLKTLTNSLGPGAQPVTMSPDAPVEVYSRVARGALKCWFGPEGSLKKTHVFHAKVDSPTSGTPAEIAVHTREDGSSHGVLRAFVISIGPAEGGSRVEAQNIRFAGPEADLMVADVGRWVTGKDDCSIVGTGGWNAGIPAGNPVPAASLPVPAARAAPVSPPKK